MKAKKSEMEYSGEEARLALCGAELKALEQWKRLRFYKDTTTNIHHVAHYAMNFALIHPEQFDRWLSALVRYRVAEDLGDYECMRSQVAARYRRKKLKLA